MTLSIEHWSVLITGIAITIGLLRSRPVLLAIALLLWVAALTVRWPRFTVFEIVVGSTGALSVTALCTALTVLGCAFGARAPAKPQIDGIARAVAVLGAVLYFGAFGFTMFDPYRYGFTPAYLLALSLPALAWSLWKGWIWLPVVLALGLASYRLELMPSSNWWDYLIDPLLWISAVIYLAVSQVVLLRQNRKSSAQPAATAPHS